MEFEAAYGMSRGSRECKWLQVARADGGTLTLYCCLDIGPATLSLVLKVCQNRLYAQSRVQRLFLCDLFFV